MNVRFRVVFTQEPRRSVLILGPVFCGVRYKGLTKAFLVVTVETNCLQTPVSWF
jgi:hypothetical protein